ncbi:MAG: NAD(P)-dependent oxidoreductase [Thermoproteota archaeon]
MKILFVESDELLEKEARKKLAQHELYFEKSTINQVISNFNDVEVLSVFVFSKVSKDVIDRFKNLKLIVTRSTGFDHIDVNYLKQKGILVCNIPGYGSVPVAEHAFALLLSGLRKIREANSSVVNNEWKTDEFEGRTIHGKTLGVLGTGSIGLNVCKIAKAFGANVIAYDIFEREKEAIEIGFKYVSFEQILENSDIIVIALPLTKDTYHIINEESIRKMKDGVVLINIARGGLIDQKALTNALKSKKVAFAGLDVLEEEPPSKEDEIIKLENVIVTPHIAWNTDYSKSFIVEKTIETIVNFLYQKPITNVV